MGYLFDTNKRLGKRGLFQTGTGEDVLNQPPASPSFLPQQAQTADPFGSQETIQTLIGLQGIQPEPDILPAEDRQEPVGSPFNSNPVLGQTPTEVQPKAGLYDSGKAKVAGMPVNEFAQLAGMAAHALDPKGFGGILGKGVAQMGAQAEQGRLGYEERQAETARKDKQYQEQKTMLLQQHKESRAAQGAAVGEKLISNKNASLSQKQAGMEMIKGYVKMIAPDITMPDFNAEEDGAFAKEISSIAKDTKLNNAQKKESILDKMHETGKIDDENYVKLRFPEDKVGTKKVENYIGQDGGVVPIDMNNPTDQGRITREGLTPYEKPTTEKTPQIRSVDRGNVVDIYENGVKVRTEPKGKLPGADKEDKPKRTAYRDTATGAINYYDINNPKDRETLQKFGSQLQPVQENPMAPVLRESLAPVTPAKSTYKTAEDVRAAYESKKISKDEAAKILRSNFGMQ